MENLMGKDNTSGVMEAYTLVDLRKDSNTDMADGDDTRKTLLTSTKENTSRIRNMVKEHLLGHQATSTQVLT